MDDAGTSHALLSAVATASTTAGDAGGEATYFLPTARILESESIGVGTAIGIGVSILLFVLNQALQQDYDHSPTPPDKNWYVECTSTMGFEADCLGFELVLEPRECVMQVKDKEDVGSDVEWQDVEDAYCIYGPGVYEGQGHSPEQLYSVEHREGCTMHYDETNNYVAKDGTFIHDSTNSAHNQVPLEGNVCISDGGERLRVANLGRGIGPLPSLANDEIGPTRQFDDGRCEGAELDWPPLEWSSEVYRGEKCGGGPGQPEVDWNIYQDHYKWSPNTDELETETELVHRCFSHIVDFLIENLDEVPGLPCDTECEVPDLPCERGCHGEVPDLPCDTECEVPPISYDPDVDEVVSDLLDSGDPPGGDGDNIKERQADLETPPILHDPDVDEVVNDLPSLGIPPITYDPDVEELAGNAGDTIGYVGDLVT